MSGAFIKSHKFILKLELTSFAQVSWREAGREQEQPQEIILLKSSQLYILPMLQSKGFSERWASHVQPLDSWPLASIELEGTSMTLQAKERRSADGQWFVDEIAILNKIGAGAKENFVKSEISMATGVTMPYTIKN